MCVLSCEMNGHVIGNLETLPSAGLMMRPCSRNLLEAVSSPQGCGGKGENDGST